MTDFNAKIDSFRELEQNWDSYDADPVGPKAIERAKWLLAKISKEAYFVCPTRCGGIQIDWGTHSELEVEINSDGQLANMYVETVVQPLKEADECDNSKLPLVYTSSAILETITQIIQLIENELRMEKS